MSVFELPTVTLIPNGIHHPPIEDGRLLPNSVKNISRTNEDGSIDLVIDAGAANEFSTGFLPKRFYKALRVKKEKGLLGSKWKYIDMIQVAEPEILSRFIESVSIDEVERILEAMVKEGVNYFG